VIQAMYVVRNPDKLRHRARAVRDKVTRGQARETPRPRNAWRGLTDEPVLNQLCVCHRLCDQQPLVRAAVLCVRFRRGRREAKPVRLKLRNRAPVGANVGP
jgi:hypothetical protein